VVSSREDSDCLITEIDGVYLGVLETETKTETPISRRGTSRLHYVMEG
jgi:hypothetical protein